MGSEQTDERQFDRIADAIEAIRRGEIVVVTDDQDRENEGDLTMAAQCVTAETINFMAKYGRGLICLPMTSDRLSDLDFRPMVNNNADKLGTAYTVSVDALEGTTTGISAPDRAHTIRKVTDPQATPSDFVRPGHVFPLQARDGGVLRRAGHTEAAVDLARLAGLFPAGVVCEIMNEDGTMARVPDLIVFAREHALCLITIEDLIAYRRRTEKLVHHVATVNLPTKWGGFVVHAYESPMDDREYLAMTVGDVSTGEPTLVRVHSECLTGDTFGSLRCDCGEQLDESARTIQREGLGVLLYLRQEGRGIGLLNKLKAYQLQEAGLDTVEANQRLGFGADLRDYGIGAQVLHDLGIRQIRMMTNNPRKIAGMKGHGLEVVERIPIQVPAQKENIRYLEAKRTKLGHLLLDDLMHPNEGADDTDGDI
ncbi:bifunctional 3,4-dihydroxy-2-butanone-4-phosphate synthase/GTP cyclohydrolase II [Candidatus Poribacteria bacterium]|jgi:3,4-dihydroxy 2-butanone 4-phosphate synthase / GTP cyclohydrolase II|nr:bifunctional 3,4-dihydroxy-2-butanone-4-phosphate synthase/GTP cyclohydrolase II [Candidatus Poribacteria bacterium]MBT5536256.1 bifunctional 3,4-dihydroxy-2-butanone-4-phosphate synthase/GTP cyclohydrolase II [Candidatus Poribacteria bacterium]MBT5713183.1 bifunctional 3,4-dihydroxy-2-butanone-4-phosphate synthase/GTP cyclohydrolase II [Candidatus Poribacteria bacterium]MBT7096354.1 bifunctional 3,4-dihydroxy-2-butanone-4-phosphate synthase/GTP cyclohydrolase II [Candidatus Poribacteria bact